MDVTEVKHAKDGKLYPVYFGMNSHVEFCKLENVTLDELNAIQSNMKLNYIISFVYVGLKHGARKSKQEFKLTLEEVGDLIDDDKEFMNNVMDVMAASQPQPDPKKSPEITADPE